MVKFFNAVQQMETARRLALGVLYSVKYHCSTAPAYITCFGPPNHMHSSGNKSFTMVDSSSLKSMVACVYKLMN
jgi:hypothetical protein